MLDFHFIRYPEVSILLQLPPKREIAPQRQPPHPAPPSSAAQLSATPSFGSRFGKREDGKHVVEQLGANTTSAAQAHFVSVYGV